MRRARKIASSGWRTAAATCGTALAAVSLAACTGGGSHSNSSGTSGALSSSAAPVAAAPAVRWWSNSVASAGSTIDPKNPAAVAAKLAPSRGEYCEMLSETLKAGKSVLAGVTASDPALVNTAVAFVTELERVAPGAVSDAWKVLSPALLALVKSNGSAPTQSKADITATMNATKVIATDAQKNCGLNLAPPKH